MMHFKKNIWDSDAVGKMWIKTSGKGAPLHGAPIPAAANGRDRNPGPTAVNCRSEIAMLLRRKPAARGGAK